MHILILSPPSSIAEWIVPLVRNLMHAELGPHDFLQLSTVDALKEDWPKRQHEHLVLFSDAPDAQVADILRGSDVPTIVIEEDPVNSAIYLQNYMNHDLAAAIRVTSLSFATLHEVVLSAGNVFLVSAKDCPSQDVLAVEIRKFLALGTDAQLPRNSKGQRTERALIRHTPSFAQSGDSWEYDFKPLFGALRPYRSIYHSGPADAFLWSPELFLATDPLGEPLLGSVDLTGPARPILYGPYLHLPIGSWNVHVHFEIRENASGNILFLEILAGNQVLSSGRTDLPKIGCYEATARFKTDEPRTPLEIRISILEGAIEGMFRLISVSLHRV